MPIDRPRIAFRPASSRSAVTNGKSLFVTGNGRGVFARRYKDLLESFAHDLGGPDCLSEAQRALVRRASALAIECERLEGLMSEGTDVPVEQYVTSANALRRMLISLFGPSLARKARDVTPDPLTYANAKTGGVS